MPEPSKPNIDEKSIPDLVKNLPSVEADTDFRNRLRSEFAEGRLGAPHAEDAKRREGGWRAGWLKWLVPAAAAAIIVVGMFSLNTPPDLRVVDATGEGDVRIGEQRIPLGDTDALNAAIAAGEEIELPQDTRIDLMADGVMLFEVAGGTRMSIPKMPGRWFGRAVACSLHVGEMRIKTGKSFSGSEFAVFTPEGRAEITGTMVSVQCDEGGTCVCVLEGIVHVGVDEDDMQPVEPGFRKIMLRDGTNEIIPVKDMHRDGVLDFDRRLGSRIEHK